MYKLLVRPLLFLLPPELAHRLVFSITRKLFLLPGLWYAVKLIYEVKDKRLERNLFGLRFKNPVGLAAGFDKNAGLVDQLSCFGFGFIEIGTVTPLPQMGNPRPRIFRLEADEAMINRMGFNNDGVDEAVNRLRARRSRVLVGGNIGKNRITANEDAVTDYLVCFEKLFDHVDFFTLNVSSPNTPALQELQGKEALRSLLSAVQQLNARKPRRKPVLLKISPDLSESQLDDVVSIVKETGIDGVIATNTTVHREGLLWSGRAAEKIGPGGLSGRPLKDRSTEVIRYLCRKSDNAFPVIGVGGIHRPKDALEKIQAGASLVQIYTGFVYEGPALVRRISKALLGKA